MKQLVMVISTADIGRISFLSRWMGTLMDEVLETVTTIAADDDDVLAVFVFGSYARSEVYRDIDICIVIWPSKTTTVNVLQKEIAYSIHDLDVSIFHNLPLYIQIEVIREGVLRLVKDEDTLHDIVRHILQDWETFRPRYEMHLESVLHGTEDYSKAG